MFDSVYKFEETIANFYGALYGVATDCGTHALELCLRAQRNNQLTCPKHTYLSVPMTFIKLGLQWSWTDEPWEHYYRLGDTNIIDASVMWEQNSYIPNTLMCLSFQFQKHLSLGRGGMILTDDYTIYEKLLKMSYDGRTRGAPWATQIITSMGYHYYMTPETAELGLEKFIKVKDMPSRQWSYRDYPDLSKTINWDTLD